MEDWAAFLSWAGVATPRCLFLRGSAFLVLGRGQVVWPCCGFVAGTKLLEVMCVARPLLPGSFRQDGRCLCTEGWSPSLQHFLIHLWEPSHGRGLSPQLLSFLIRSFQLLWPVHCHRRGATGHLPFKNSSGCGSPTLRFPPAFLAL